MKIYICQWILFICVTAILQRVAFATGCTYPDILQNSRWVDFRKGLIGYTENTMTGWDLHVYIKTISEWECYMTNADFVVSKSKMAIDVFGTNMTAYLCQRLRQHDDNTVYYYQMSDVEENAENERVHIGSETVTRICDVCGPEIEPLDTDYRIMIREGTEEFPDLAAKVDAGCNSCLYECDKPGTPMIVQTTEAAKEHRYVPTDAPRKRNNRVVEDDSGALGVGGIVGITVGAVVGVGITVGVVVWFVRR